MDLKTYANSSLDLNMGKSSTGPQVLKNCGRAASMKFMLFFSTVMIREPVSKRINLFKLDCVKDRINSLRKERV